MKEHLSLPSIPEPHVAASALRPAGRHSSSVSTCSPGLRLWCMRREAPLTTQASRKLLPPRRGGPLLSVASRPVSFVFWEHHPDFPAADPLSILSSCGSWPDLPPQLCAKAWPASQPLPASTMAVDPVWTPGPEGVNPKQPWGLARGGRKGPWDRAGG